MSEEEQARSRGGAGEEEADKDLLDGDALRSPLGLAARRSLRLLDQSLDAEPMDTSVLSLLVERLRVALDMSTSTCSMRSSRSSSGG